MRSIGGQHSEENEKHFHLHVTGDSTYSRDLQISIAGMRSSHKLSSLVKKLKREEVKKEKMRSAVYVIQNKQGTTQTDRREVLVCSK